MKISDRFADVVVVSLLLFLTLVVRDADLANHTVLEVVTWTLCCLYEVFL